ncbi:unnamed protein product [Camellia sinensis]
MRTVDFIFGNAAALFQDCDIHARKPDAGHMLTAQGRIDKQPKHRNRNPEMPNRCHCRSHTRQDQLPYLPGSPMEGVFEDDLHAINDLLDD